MNLTLIKNLPQILAMIKSWLGVAHKGVKSVEKVIADFEKVLGTLDAAVGTIDKTASINRTVIDSKVAENAALEAKRAQALVLKQNLGALIGK